jgi:hypothetical protein
VLPAATMLTPLRVKPDECTAVDALLAYVILPQDSRPCTIVLRRSDGWALEAWPKGWTCRRLGQALLRPTDA